MSTWAIVGISVLGGIALVALIAYRRWKRRQPAPPDPPDPDPDPDPDPPVPPLPGDGTVFVLVEMGDIVRYTADQRDMIGEPDVRKALQDAGYRFLVFDQHVTDERGRTPQQYIRYFEVAELDRLPWLVIETSEGIEHSRPLPLTLAEFWQILEAI